MQRAQLEYSNGLVDYALIDPVPIQTSADSMLEEALNTEDKNYRNKLLEVSAGKYFLLSKINPYAVTPYVQLARIYDIKREDRRAKEYFYKATNLEYRNPFANFYFGEYYFRRDRFKKALGYYLTAYNNGYSEVYEVNLRLATTYEKLGDLVKSKKYYEFVNSVNPSDNTIQKIRQIESLNYDKSEYYKNIIRESK